ncbi:MAG: type III secretion system cytoplasmic ring protein SctQ [Chlamydiia bacterium]|nr:type III secretion system cytoplasmic ring protein SctQ [Chlamydiia bacterium]
MTLQSSSEFFIKTIDRALVELDTNPQFALPVPFPYEELAKGMETIFATTGMSIRGQGRGWESAVELSTRVKETYEIFLSPFASPLYFSMEMEEIKRLMMALLDGEEGETFFLDPSYVEGFYTFFQASFCEEVHRLGFTQDLQPVLGKKVLTLASDAEKGFFTFDLILSFDRETFHAHLFVPESFKSSWNTHFASAITTLPPHLDRKLNEKVALELSFEVGRTLLKYSEWEKVACGDWILLDDVFYDPELKTGRLVMSLNGTPLFRGKIKDEGIKLYEYPTYEEVKPTMDDEDFDEDEDLYGDLDEDFDYDEESLDDEDFEEEDEEEYDEEDEEEYDEEEEIEEKEDLEERPPFAQEKTKKAKEVKPLSIDRKNVPVEIVCEVGRVKMSAKELMELTPGNLLELNLPPERGIDLLVGGKKVGRGELLKLGEAVGVRIIEL